jgi:hypothetical protein
MKKFISGFLAGAAVSGVLFFVLLRSERRYSWEGGRRSGIIQGHFDVADALQKEFGVHDGSPYKLLLEVKTTDIVSVETNGIKTVRIIP